jgi:hypothetical protein
MENLFSHHFFLFPFSWEHNTLKKDSKHSLFDKTNINKIKEKINEFYWEAFNFSFKIDEKYNTYNDFIYFYDQVRDVLNLSREKTNVNGLQYQYKNLTEESQYIISINGEKELVLRLKDVYVNFYESGVGIFVFYLENHSESDFNRILKINEYGRRIFPQFLGFKEPYTNETKWNFLSSKITLRNIVSTKSLIEEDFSYYDHLENLNKEYFRLPNHIGDLLGEHFSGNPKQKDCDKIYLLPVLDDRMYVISHIYKQDLIKEFSEFNSKTNQYNYQTNLKWYRYLYIDDSSASCTSKNMIYKQLTSQSYDRWIESKDYNEKGGMIAYSGLLFGISRYSFVLLSGESDFNRNIIGSHIKNMYFQMVMLTLLQRTYLINFGNEIARIGKNLHFKTMKTQNIKDINALYLLYIKYRNSIYYREVTSQEQGIELYDLLQQTLRIEPQVKDLDDELKELNEYVQTLENTKLTKVASMFLPVTLLASVLGMNSIEFFDKIDQTKKVNIQFTILLFLTIGIILWTIYLLIKHFRKNNFLS